MKYKGINYDIGTKTISGEITRVNFDPAVIIEELQIIQQVLHCNAVRISGLDIDRIVRASTIALQLGLTVFFSPALHDENRQNTIAYILNAAAAAEMLRADYSNVIFVAGCELSLFTEGFVNGKNGLERMRNMFGPLSMIKNMLGIRRRYNGRLSHFLSGLVGEIRKRFRGPVTYASGTWEKPDWEIFDMIGIDHYRASYNKPVYMKQLSHYKRFGKPIIITEFGCCSYKGAEEKGAMGWAIIDWQKQRPQLKAPYIRDENTQAKELVDLLKIFDEERIAGAFVFTFVNYHYFHHDDPKYDLDMASYGIVKSLPADQQGYSRNLHWLPKKAFYAIGNFFGVSAPSMVDNK